MDGGNDLPFGQDRDDRAVFFQLANDPFGFAFIEPDADPLLQFSIGIVGQQKGFLKLQFIQQRLVKTIENFIFIQGGADQARYLLQRIQTA